MQLWDKLVTVMVVTPQIREEACRLICSKISPGKAAVDFGVRTFGSFRPGTFTYSAIETVAELLVAREAISETDR